MQPKKNCRSLAASSITHKSSSNHNAKLNIDATCEASPDHHVAGGRVIGAGEVAPEPRKSGIIESKGN